MKYGSILYNHVFHGNIIKIIKEVFTKVGSYICVDKIMSNTTKISIESPQECGLFTNLMYLLPKLQGKYPKYVKADDSIFTTALRRAWTAGRTDARKALGYSSHAFFSSSAQMNA
jgi:hypothetical protein